MEKTIAKELQTLNVRIYGRAGGGCINNGQGYLTDMGHIFLKENRKSGALQMFTGELQGLRALKATGCLKVPKPVKVFSLEQGAAVVMEYVEMQGLGSADADLGERLARLHLHNLGLRDRGDLQDAGDMNEERLKYVDKFGFDVTTCCGYLPLDNTWNDDWPDFYTRQRLQPQIDLAVKNYQDHGLVEVFSKLLPKIPTFFRGVQIYPSLLHGDLWPGNAAQVADTGEPIIFDPAAFYGHHEHDLSIAKMFGGFSKHFFGAYHKVIPKESGFDIRSKLYQLFHYLNHYNHFGAGYRSQCMVIMQDLSNVKV